MSDRTSLFARSLREHRVGHGKHGRMTQEELAASLGVSVDAIGKYERSLSFIRGDLEHRLAERLGWSPDDIRACREDWESRQRARGRANSDNAYRVLDDALVDDVFGGSWLAAGNASVDLAEQAFPDLPEEFAAAPEIFGPVYGRYPDFWCGVMLGDRMVAKWALPFLMPEDEERFRAGTLMENTLTADRIRLPLLPGTYYGYCPALVIHPGHQAASALLLRSFIRFLESLADREVFLHGIGTVTVSLSGEQVCRDLGMTRLGSHCLQESFGLWELPGASIPPSIFGRRSPLLRQRYAEAFAIETHA